MDTLIGLLPLVVLLACPLMMGLCFWGMRRTDCTADAPPASGGGCSAAGDVTGSTLAEQIAGLQERLAQLKAEQDEIAVQLAELAWQEGGDGMAEERQQVSAASPSTEATAAQT